MDANGKLGRLEGGFVPEEVIVSEPFIGEIMIASFNWAPVGWHLCDGSILPVAQNQALFTLIGKTFGGDGVTTFGLPDLRGRTPIGPDPTGATDPAIRYVQGNAGGAETVTLTVSSTPPHGHTVNATTTNGNVFPPAGAELATTVNSVTSSTAQLLVYQPNAAQIPNPVALAGTTIGNAGASQGHSNMQPYAVVNFCIATTGYYPSRP